LLQRARIVGPTAVAVLTVRSKRGGYLIWQNSLPSAPLTTTTSNALHIARIHYCMVVFGENNASKVLPKFRPLSRSSTALSLSFRGGNSKPQASYLCSRTCKNERSSFSSQWNSCCDKYSSLPMNYPRFVTVHNSVS
jgi:hypothetical protein